MAVLSQTVPRTHGPPSLPFPTTQGELVCATQGRGRSRRRSQQQEGQSLSLGNGQIRSQIPLSPVPSRVA